MAAARRASGHGRLAHPHGTATADNPLCGDRVTVDVAFAPTASPFAPSAPADEGGGRGGARAIARSAGDAGSGRADAGRDAAARLARIGHVVRGCVLCEAAAVLIAERAPERAPEELLRAGAGVEAALRDGTPFPWPELEMFAPVRGIASRHRCVGLPFEALAAALSGSTWRGAEPSGPR